MKKVKDIGLYLVYSDGSVYSKHYNRFLKPQKNRNYLTYKMFNKMLKVHRVVAEAFIPNPNNKPQVNHKDGNKLNNDVSNLEWVTASENGLHSYKLGLSKKEHLLNRVGDKNPNYRHGKRSRLK